MLRSGDLTAEEVKREENHLKEQEEKQLIEEGKIVFRTSKKRAAKEEDPLDANVKGKKLKKEDSSLKSKDSKKHNSVKKSSLLSFQDEEEDL